MVNSRFSWKRGAWLFITSNVLKGQSSRQFVRRATEILFETHFSPDSKESLESGDGLPLGGNHRELEWAVARAQGEQASLWQVHQGWWRLQEEGRSWRLGTVSYSGQGTDLSQQTLAFSSHPSTHRAKQLLAVECAEPLDAHTAP